MQTRSVDAVPAAPTYTPAPHVLCGAHIVALRVVLNVLAAHAEQVRSAAGPPVLLTKVPASQFDQGVHEVAFGVALKVPLGHSAQTRLMVEVPAVLTDIPGPHAVHSAHWLAGLASWSQVPLPQTTGSASAPAQYSPGAHGVHGPACPGIVCFEPAAHAP